MHLISSIRPMLTVSEVMGFLKGQFAIKVVKR
ncbi:hypothetical protein [Salinibacter ruber]